jgi:putative sterol carrier protein
MATLEDITQRFKGAVGAGTDLGRTLKFDLKGEGFIHIDGTTVSNADDPADCTVVISREDLEALARGQLDPMTAMMRGRLKIKGDMAVAMQLQSLLRGRA